jgi:ABC-2 type transport system ATP-binding protein
VIEGPPASCTAHGDVGALVAMLSTWGVVELDSRELSLEEVFLSEFAAESRA